MILGSILTVMVWLEEYNLVDGWNPGTFAFFIIIIVLILFGVGQHLAFGPKRSKDD
ncbi:MAG: hypothetical protein ABSF09_05620 [Candidatus Bathyarchaeia archaeon]